MSLRIGQIKLFSLVFMFMVVHQLHADRLQDSMELVRLYNNTSGPDWKNPWQLDQSMDTWFGVTLNEDGTVNTLKLSANGLSGDLPNLILPNLTQLALNINDLRNVISDFNYPNCTFLDLSNNGFVGEVPNFVGMPQLLTLRLQNNNLTGEVPEFSSVPNLQVIDLSNNNLEGQLPTLQQTPGIFSLNLAGNNLIGTIPDYAFANLVLINLSNNRLSGFIPEFNASPNLIQLNLAHNALAGPVPKFLINPLLSNIDLSYNQLTGDLPAFNRVLELIEFRISNNLLDGPIPVYFQNEKLEILDLSNNQLSGFIPDYDTESLRILDLSNNLLTDTFPALGDLINLEQLIIDSNQISHTLFKAIDHPALTTLYVHNNELTFSDIFDFEINGVIDFQYAPQANIPLIDTIYATIRDDVIIDLVVDDGISNTQTWFKDNMFLQATEENRLLLLNINALDQGRYHAQVRNNRWPALTLFSDTTVLVMGCPFDTLRMDLDLCAGDSLVINDVVYTESGNYRDTITVFDPGFCDTLLLLDLRIRENYDTLLIDTICENEFYSFGDTLLNETGSYVDSLVSIFGCDSIIRLELTVNPVYTQVREEIICDGDTLFVGNLARFQTGIYFDTLQSALGCDSVIITDLTTLESFRNDTFVVVCSGESFTWRGELYTESGRYFERFQNRIGCDSTYVLNLTISEPIKVSSLRRICSGDSIQVGENTYSERGIYTDTLISILGCDSIVLTMLDVQDAFEDDFDFVICQGDTLHLGDTFFTTPGIYLDTFVARGGCDSIVKIRLNVIDEIRRDQSYILCAGDSVLINGQYYSGNIDFQDTVSSEFCDTITDISISTTEPIRIDLVQILYNQESDVGSIEVLASGGIGGYLYEWNNGMNSSMIDSVSGGTYFVTVSDLQGCSAMDSFVVDQTTSVFTNLDNVSIKVYPNPLTTSQELTLEILHHTGQGSNYQVDIHDLFGRQILQQQYTGSSIRKQLIMPSAAGMYLMRITDDQNNRWFTKISVK